MSTLKLPIFLPGLLVVVVISSIETASARGFCNADHLGSEKFQSIVASAGKQFYNGGATFMELMALSEEEEINTEKISALGQESAKSLLTAEQLYRTAATVSAEESVVGESIATVDFGVAMDIAGHEFEEVGLSAEQYFSICADSLKRFTANLENFTQYIEETPREELREQEFSSALRSWTEVLLDGIAVSAVFAAAGGETPQ